MSAIEAWNDLAQRWLAWAVQAASMSTLALVLVGAVWLAVRRRASAHLGALLFLVPLLPLALPPLGVIELRLPAGAPGAALLAPRRVALHDEPAADLHAGALPDALAVTNVESGSADAAPVTRTAAQAPRGEPTLAAWLFLVWSLAVASLLARLIAVQLDTQRLARRASPLAGAQGTRVRAAVERLRARTGVRRPLPVLASDEVASPAVWGLRRPVLLLPPELPARLDDDQLDWVLLHELAHVARRDLAVAALQRAVQILWFFHPVAWLSGRVAEELRECACDETALARSPSPRPRRCAEALLEVVAGRLPRPTPALALQTLHDETTLMKKRILRLIDPRRAARSGLSPAALPVLVVLAGASLASVRLTQEPVPEVVLEEIEEVFEEADVDLDAARDATDRALAWLLAQQKPDGHWPTGPATEVDTGEFNSIGVTGLAVLALLEEQARDAEPARAAAIERALGYLAGIQDAETGLFGPVRGHRVMASHAAATLAWLRAHPDREAAAWRPAAEAAVAAILRAHNPYRGWRFGHVPDGDNDSFMTSLMLSTLAEAQRRGLEVPEQTVRSGLSFLEQMTEPSSGRTGYDDRGSLAPRLAGRGEDFPAEHSEMCTAMAIVARLDWGERPIRSKAIRDGAHLIASAAPDWDPVRGSTDFYHWLFGTAALERLGGYAFEHWRMALLHALVPHQRPEGWWPAVDAWSDEGTTVHATVVNTLALQSALR